MPESLVISNLEKKEMKILLDWAAAEGWNPGLYDAECFFAADTQGFFLAELAGEPVGCISAVAYGLEFGFLGFYIVRPDQRGKGIGMCLWQAALDYLGSRTVGLDGVVAQQENYRKSGFILAYRNVRYVLDQARDFSKSFGGVPSARVTALSDISFHEVQAYDRILFSQDRSDFLRLWISRPGTVSRGIQAQGVLRGYGVMRPCRDGYKIGPLFASGLADASVLLDELLREVDHGPVYLDIPELNRAAQELVRLRQFKPVFETARMYRGNQPAIPVEQVFGVSSFELG